MIRKQVCGAKTRRGTPCQCKKLYRGSRCRFHGGLSTGPKTAEGKRRALAALRAGNRAWRARRGYAGRTAAKRDGELGGMALTVEENELTDPVSIRLFGVVTEMTAPAHNSQPVEQTGPIGGVVTP
jgi:hypothetical protein